MSDVDPGSQVPSPRDGRVGDPDIPGISAAEPWRWTQARTLAHLQTCLSNYARSTELTIAMVGRMKDRLEDAMAADLVAETETLLAASFTAGDPTRSAIERDEQWLEITLDETSASKAMQTDMRISIKSAALTLAGSVDMLRNVLTNPYADWTGFEPLVDALAEIATAAVFELHGVEDDEAFAAVWEEGGHLSRLADRFVDLIDLLSGHIERSA